MGNSKSSDISRLNNGEPRNLYVTCDRYYERKGTLGPYKVFELTVSHQRYSWKIHKRYNELIHLHSKVKHILKSSRRQIYPPPTRLKLVWKRHNERTLEKRGREAAQFIENLGTVEEIWRNEEFMDFLEITKVSFLPELGRKGKCGYLKKVRAGVFSSWRWRVVVAHDTFIASYIPGPQGVTTSDVPEEVLRIDSGLSYTIQGRYINISSHSGHLSFAAYTHRQAEEWKFFLDDFYSASVSPRCDINILSGTTTYPPRCSDEKVEAFVCSRDYFHALAVLLLNATSDILITSNELSPTVLLTRPPLPPLRLDQILRFKANQGVSIYIMINREGNPSTTPHNCTTTSAEVKAYLQSISENIRVIRVTKPPSGAFQNEKLVVVDRVHAFVGNIDLTFGHFDDFGKNVEDESGIKYPGSDYVQPHAKRMRPTKFIHRSSAKHHADSKNEDDKYVMVNVEPSDEETITNSYAEQSIPTPYENESSMYGRSPFPFLQGTIDDNSVSINNAEVLSDAQNSYNVDVGITRRMNTMFDDEAPSEDDEECPPDFHARPSSAKTSNGQKKKSTLAESFLNVLSSIGNGIEAVASLFQPEPFIDLREEHPRQPWHGVQVYMNGLCARDASSHFLQKWHHHRTNSSQMNSLIASDVTDNLYSSICARCNLSNVYEDIDVCPNCGLPLGPVSKYSAAYKSSVESRFSPVTPDSYSFVVFECQFSTRMGCTLHGNGPVAVERVTDSPIDMSGGKLLFEQGPYANVLGDRGLFPSIGDIIVSVDYTNVTHLDFAQVKKFVEKRFEIRQREHMPVSISFRRHHVQSVVNTYNRYNERASIVHASANLTAPVAVEVVSIDIDDSKQQHQDDVALDPHVNNQYLSENQSTSVETPPSPVRLETEANMSAEMNRFSRDEATANPNNPEESLFYSSATLEASQWNSSMSNIHDASFIEEQQEQECDESAVQFATDMHGYPSLSHFPKMSEKREDSPSAAILRDEKLGEEEDSTPEQHDLESFLRRRNIQAASEQRSGEEASRQSEEVSGAEEDTAKTRESERISQHMVDEDEFPSYPEAPQSIPDEMFPTVPTHDIHDITSSAHSRSRVESTESNEVTHSFRKKEASMSGKPSSGIPNEAPLPTAKAIDENSNVGAQLMQLYNCSPLFVPDDIFVPRNRLHACEEAIQMDVSLAMSILGNMDREGPLDSRDLYPFDMHHPLPVRSAGPLCQVQLLRSASEWSLGIRSEQSVVETWIRLIERSEHLIYIESSYFMAMLPSKGTKYSGLNSNSIIDALLSRTLRAVQRGDEFRIIIVLPELPSANVSESNRYPVVEKNLQAQCHSISDFVSRFKDRFPRRDMSEFVGFYSLRSWGVLNDKVVNSQVYVSSSVLIVDDKAAVIGSASLCDQDMIGSHDSNLAVLIEDTTAITIQLGGREYEASKFSHTLRMNLMRHHTGDNNGFSSHLEDPACHQEMSGYNLHWKRIADQNARIYSMLDGNFHINSFNSLEDLRKQNIKENFIHKSEHDAQVQQSLGEIQGFLVPFPLSIYCK